MNRKLYFNKLKIASVEISIDYKRKKNTFYDFFCKIENGTQLLEKK